MRFWSCKKLTLRRQGLALWSHHDAGPNLHANDKQMNGEHSRYTFRYLVETGKKKDAQTAKEATFCSPLSQKCWDRTLFHNGHCPRVAELTRRLPSLSVAYQRTAELRSHGPFRFFKSYRHEIWPKSTRVSMVSRFTAELIRGGLHHSRVAKSSTGLLINATPTSSSQTPEIFIASLSEHIYAAWLNKFLQNERTRAQRCFKDDSENEDNTGIKYIAVLQ